MPTSAKRPQFILFHALIKGVSSKEVRTHSDNRFFNQKTNSAQLSQSPEYGRSVRNADARRSVAGD
jgi:hypothetical protein